MLQDPHELVPILRAMLCICLSRAKEDSYWSGMLLTKCWNQRQRHSTLASVLPLHPHWVGSSPEFAQCATRHATLC